MADGALQYLLLMGACLSLIGLGLSGMLVSRAQASNDQRAKRLEAILTPHMRSAQIELSAFTVTDNPRPARCRHRSVLDLRLQAGTSGAVSGEVVHHSDRSRSCSRSPVATRPTNCLACCPGSRSR